MSRDITICVVGAGSSYTPELIDGILQQFDQGLPVTRIRMTDIDDRRLSVMAGLSQRMVKARNKPITIESDTSLERMLEGVDYVITQVRVGGMTARTLDETIPLKYDIVGQETTGPGGMFKALRTIPVMIDIASTVARVAGDAWMLNYTNPSGIITEALTRHTRAKVIGLCSGLPGMRKRLASQLGERFGDVKIYCVGLNHLGFVHRILADGRDVTVEAIDHLHEAEVSGSADPGRLEWLKLGKLLGALPIAGYSSYYYHRRRRVKELQSQEKTRAQRIAEIEKALFEEAAKPDTVVKPEVLKQRGGGGYSNVTFSVMRALYTDSDNEIAMSQPNRGTVEGIEDEASVEIVCRVGKDGPKPVPVGPIPIAFRGLVQAVKAYETLTVQAAVTRDRTLALQALLAHPLVGDIDVAEPLLDEMLTAHKLDFS